MDITLKEELAVKLKSFNGITVYKISQDRFKTNTINIFFHDTLTRETAALNALMPAVLRRGCEKFPTFKDIAVYLEKLYGTSFDCGVAKKGEIQLIQFYIEYVADQYTQEGKGMFEKAFELLFEIITKPVTESGIFKEEYVVQEKENLKRLIESRVNDKVQYAVDRCYEEMCGDEPFGVYEYGTAQDVDKITNKQLYEQYNKILGSLPIDIFVTGDTEDARILKMAEKFSSLNRVNIKNIKAGNISKQIEEVKNITEKMSINQGKLSMGFRTNTAPAEPDYYALMAYSILLGGGMHSKLFQNVREKASLAYYAFSRLEKFKGLMVVSSGIETENRDKAKEIIMEQLGEIEKGNITDNEFDATVKTIETGIKSLKDSQLQMVDFYLSQNMAGTNDTFDTLVQKVNKLTKQDIAEVSKKIKLDTVYFLTKA
ncbi:MAG: pitrilysin family protein [Bacillota bacterium]|nr:pitrilysin family protein [Bacillota bacterium]